MVTLGTRCSLQRNDSDELNRVVTTKWLQQCVAEEPIDDTRLEEQCHGCQRQSLTSAKCRTRHVVFFSSKETHMKVAIIDLGAATTETKRSGGDDIDALQEELP